MWKEQEKMARYPPGFTSFSPLTQSSLYPLRALGTECLFFAKEGGSMTMRSNSSLALSSFLRKSKAFASTHSIPERPFSSSFFLPISRARSDMSTAMTSFAPIFFMLRAKPPVWQKTSRHLSPGSTRLLTNFLEFLWSRKKPVF